MLPKHISEDVAGQGESTLEPHADQGNVELSRPALLRSLYLHDNLFHDIDNNHPEADVRHRFQGLRSIRANYNEANVFRWERKRLELREAIRAGRLDPEDSAVQNSYDEIMEALVKHLDRCSRALEQDTLAAQAPVVDPHFMDSIYRYNVVPDERGSRAPNGEPKDTYGSVGDPIPTSLTALRGCEDDILHRVIVRRLMTPINHYIYTPLQELLYTKILRRTLAQDEQGLDGRTLEVIVSVLECTVSAAYMSGTVALLYNINDTRNRLIVTGFLNILFPLFVVFLSRQALSIFTLTAAYWAVMVVYNSTVGYSSQCTLK